MNDIITMQFGSHVYGTNVATSDTDYKSLIMPSPEEIILQRVKKVSNKNTNNTNTKNAATDIDHEIFVLNYWFHLFAEGQTLCYDMLFTPKEFMHYGSEYGYLWDEIQGNKDKLVNSKISAFAGYCQHQAAKYSLKGSNLAAYRTARDYFASKPSRLRLRDIRDDIIIDLMGEAIAQTDFSPDKEPLIKLALIKNNKGVDEEYLQVGPKTKVPLNANCDLARQIFSEQFDKYGERAKQAESNNGVDWKALMHAVRIVNEANELLSTGHITFPRPEASTLLAIRKGEMKYTQVAEIIEAGLLELKRIQPTSTLRATPDQEWIDDFVYNAYLERVNETVKVRSLGW